MFATGGDFPADVQYNPYIGPNPGFTFPWGPAHVIGRSVFDYQLYPHVAADWSYQPGVIEITFHDDFYWWSGDRLTAEDYLLELEYEDYLYGGDDLDAHEPIISREQIDDHTFRLTLADSWTEDWAISQTVEGFDISPSRALTTPWIEEFEDAGDLDAVEDLRDHHQNDNVLEDDEELVHVYFTPFEFRLDGSIGDVGENYWELELIQEKDGNLRHHANDEHFEYLPNYARARYEIHEEADVVSHERFAAEDQPWAGGQERDTKEAALAGEFDFEVSSVAYFEPFSQTGGIQFNHAAHPGDDARFRRAFAYLVDSTTWEDFSFNTPTEFVHVFFTDEELRASVSEEVIDAFTDYGYDEIRFDEAETELEAGGYERDADGRWLLQEDSAEGEAGEPMRFTMGTWSWMGEIPDLGSDWVADLADFGIELDIPLDLQEDWTVAYTYNGGGSPAHALGNVFLELDWARPEYSIPSTVLAPPLGETATAGDSMDDWREYEVITMAERLPVTTDESMHQQLVDELVWVVNQVCHHMSTAPGASGVALNQGQWNWPSQQEMTPRFTGQVFRTAHFGLFQYDGD